MGSWTFLDKWKCKKQKRKRMLIIFPFERQWNSREEGVENASEWVQG